MAAYVPCAAGGFVLRSEGGHTTLPGATPREDAIIKLLRQKFGHVSAERVLSGPGMQNLYRAIVSIDGWPAPERNAAEITQAGLDGVCGASRAALDLFCAWLGEVAGNFALAFCAQGGVFLCGGVVPHLRNHLPSSEFRARFEAKGRMSDFVARIPVFLVLHEDPAFIGLQEVSNQR
jgi:glucokinase